MRDDADEINRKAREIVAQHKRERELAKWRRAPVDDAYVAKAPIADWRGYTSTKEMPPATFNAWCDAGKPPLTSAERASPRDLKVTKAQVDAAIDRERANLQASLEAVAEILGEEVALLENKMRADFKAAIDAVRAEIGKQELRGGDDIIDLPADWRPHVEH
jgi:hypothetical protein